MPTKGYISLFDNKRVEQGRNQPTKTGSLRLNRAMVEEIYRAPRDNEGNVDLRVALWPKQGPKAGEYLSGEVSFPQDQQRPSRRDDRPPRDDYRRRDDDRGNHRRRDDDDEIPF